MLPMGKSINSTYKSSIFQISQRYSRIPQCSNIPEPPQLIVTWRGTWLQAAVYYFKYFQQITSLVVQFNPKEATAIKENCITFQDAQIEADLQTVYSYKEMAEATEKWQNPLLSCK